MPQKVDFYFDVVSPYSYFASKSIEELVSRNDAELDWKPCFLGGIFKILGVKISPGLMPHRKAYFLKDLQRVAGYHNIPFQMPVGFPDNTLMAMRILCGLPEEQIAEAAHQLFQAYWADGKNITDPRVLTDLLGTEAVERASDPEIKSKLIEASDEAALRGAFGVPTFFVGDNMFFGHDRMYLLEQCLQGNL